MNKYILGLDIGTTSIGFSLADVKNGEIIAANSVIFNRKETKKGNATAERREGRAGRRLISRRWQRKRNTRKLLHRYNLVEKDFVVNTREYIKNNPIENIFFLRHKAVRESISDYELSRIIYAFSDRRGYSDRYAIDTEKDSGVIKQSIGDIQALMSNYNTFGEMVWELYSEKCRNGSGEYSRMATMRDIKHELIFILNRQKELGNKKITDGFIDEVLSEETFSDGSVSLFYQRPLKGISKMVGLCSYQHHLGYKRASKASKTFLEYVFLEKLHNTTVDFKGEEKTLFSIIGVKQITLFDDNINFEDALQKFIKNDGKYNSTFIKTLFDEKERKYLKVKLDKNKESENKTLGKDACLLINELDRLKIKLIDNNKIDLLAHILTIYQDEKQKTEEIKKKFNEKISDSEVKLLSQLDFSGFGRLSIETMQSMIPLMRSGKTPYEAKKECGFTLNTNIQKLNFLPPLQCDKDYIENILSKRIEGFNKDNFIPFYDATNNPIVNRVVSVLRKVINQIIGDYGVPERIVVELAREYNSEREKKEMDIGIRKRTKEREILQDKVKKLGFEANSRNVEKYELWSMQNGKCLYSNTKIGLQDVFSENVEIEHVLPRSKVNINAQKNKILVFKKENQEKRDNYHYDYLERIGRWNIFCVAVKELQRTKKISEKKAQWLLSEDFSNVTKESYLNDTKYATRLICNYLNYYLYPTDDIHGTGSSRKIYALNGKATSFFRKYWGIQNINEVKNRDNHYHHAIDAVTLSFITPKMINEISRYYKEKEFGRKPIFELPYKDFRKDVLHFIDRYKNDEKFVYHVQKIKKNAIAYNRPISVFVKNEEKFEKNKIPVFDFIEKVVSDYRKTSNQKSLEILIKENTSKIIDNSTDKFIINNIGIKIKTFIKLDDMIKNLEAEKKEVRNNQDILEEIDSKIKTLLERKRESFVVKRGKKKTPQIIKNIHVVGSKIESINEVSNAKDNTPQYRKNKTSMGMKIFEKDSKKYCIPLYVANIWNKNKIQVSKNGTTIDDSFSEIIKMSKDDIVELKKKKHGNREVVIYIGVGGNSENFEYKPINQKSAKRLFCSVNTLLNIEKKEISIYGEIL